MPPLNWQRIDEAFDAALDVPPEERRAWLEKHYGQETELRREVESLLAAEAASPDFLPRAGFAKAAGLLLSETVEAHEGQRVGRYHILRELGRGGMGIVFLAEREDEEFHQRVAVKLVKRGLDTEDILRRFRNERQILASLNHPNIAKLFDGGTNEDGQPYFVMEYIEGLPLLQYCDQQGLSTDERLRLFRNVCAAVQHAHQNLVIHRDIKPSNILVTGEGEVKLLDFGVAKFLKPELSGTEATATQTAMRVMTPEYASPEQVRGDHLTTATDIYSLGVVLYELLTGARPYKLKDASPAELSRAICDSEPSKPSEAVTDSKNLSSNPHSEIRNPKLLKGDIDNIVLMALRKEPLRRYKSVEQFAEDIRRHLEGLPITAHKDTFAYRASKFVRRNRIGVTAACLVFLTLLGGIFATLWQAGKAREQAALANAKTVEAQAALQKTEKINHFMQSIFSYANPDWFGRAGGRRDMSVLEAMRDIEKHIDEDFRDEPDLRADVYQQIGDSYRTQGLNADAERSLREALRLRLELYGEDSAKVAESMYILSGVRHQQGEDAEYERLLTKALSIQRRHPDEGNNLPYMVADYANYLTSFKNDYAGALPVYRESLEISRRRYGESHYMTSIMKAKIVEVSGRLGDYAQAEALALEYLKQPQADTFYVMASLAWIQIIKGDYRATEDTLRQMSAMAQGADAKPYMLPMIYDIQSFAAYRRGDYAQAIAYAEKAFATRPNDASASYTRAFFLAQSLNKFGQAKRAETLLLEEIERLRHTERVFDSARLKSILGESLTAQRRFAQAEAVLLEAYETQKARVLPEQYDRTETRQRLAALYRAWGKPDDARSYE